MGVQVAPTFSRVEVGTCDLIIFSLKNNMLMMKLASRGKYLVGTRHLLLLTDQLDCLYSQRGISVARLRGGCDVRIIL